MSGWQETPHTAVLIFRDGTRLEGHGIGAVGMAAGEVCFNTAFTGYQEVLTDPSYTNQIIAFTFPHIGNVGTTDEDIEAVNQASTSGAVGLIIKADITSPSNYRSSQDLDSWLKKRGIIGIAGIDTRALTALIRENGMMDAVIAHSADGKFDEAAIQAMLADFRGLDGQDIATDVSTTQSFSWDQGSWKWDQGYTTRENSDFHVVAIDYGAKRNILRCLVDEGAKVTIVPATSTAEEILAYNPDGIFISNGPGDPAATGVHAVPTIKTLVETGKPIFGICLGHQLLGIALGGKTEKMHQGHHGANHPVKNIETGRVEITSMNHGFAVDRASLPDTVEETHISLFDGSNAGLQLKGKPVFSVQYHPEASPGPEDSHYLFKRFANYIREQKGLPVSAD